jgi:hypothetical protein
MHQQKGGIPLILAADLKRLVPLDRLPLVRRADLAEAPEKEAEGKTPSRISSRPWG